MHLVTRRQTKRSPFRICHRRPAYCNCTNLDCDFDNASSDPDGTMTWQWTFGDDATSVVGSVSQLRGGRYLHRDADRHRQSWRDRRAGDQAGDGDRPTGECPALGSLRSAGLYCRRTLQLRRQEYQHRRQHREQDLGFW